MARPPATNKRDNEKKRHSKRAEKEKRKEERKKNNNKGATLEDMFMYVDANGQLTSTPPDMQNVEKVDLDSIIISTPKKVEEDNPVHKGRVEHFNAAKGYGFIKELSSINKYFFHISATKENIKEGNIVYFELERGTKDMNAVNIRFEENVTPPASTEVEEENQD